MAKTTVAPIPPFRSGNAKLDEAVRVIQTRYPEDHRDVYKATGFVEKLPAKDKKPLAALLDPAIFGNHYYCTWVLAELASFPEGRARLFELLRAPEKQVPRNVLEGTLSSLDRGGKDAERALCEAFPPESWPTLTTLQLDIVKTVGILWVRANRERAYEVLAPLCAVKGGDAVVVEGILHAVDVASRRHDLPRYATPPKDRMPTDERWAEVALAWLARSKKASLLAEALNVLLDLPPNGAWRDAVKAALPKLSGDAEDLAKELLEKLPKGKTVAPKGKGPLPPEPRGRAPKPAKPKGPAPAELGKRIDAMLAKAGLAKHKSRVVDPAIHLYTKRAEGAAIPLGATKIGGLPDLPKGTKWPVHAGCPLGFVAQIRLEDVAALGETRLPKKGLLSFFVDDDGDDYLGKTVVIHTPTPKGLVRTEPPAGYQAQREGRPARQPYEACEVTFEPTVTVASASHPSVTEHLTDAERAAYEKHVTIEKGEVAQLLGFRDHGYDAENPESARLLLRLTSDPQAGMSWGDDDCLDIYVPKADLAKGVFKKAYAYCGD